MKLSQFFFFFKNAVLDGAKNSTHQIIPFGILGIICIVPFYFINLKVSPNVYENLPLRIIGSIMCLFLVLKNYWPTKLQKFLPLYWYITLLYMPSFFLFFMAFKNNLSPLWQMNVVMLILFLALLVDWVGFIILVSLGLFFASIAYYLTPHTLSLPEQMGGMITFLVSILIYALFSRNNQRIEHEKLQIMHSLSASIAHELRTPLRTIDSSVEGIRHFLPQLIEGYELARDSDLPISYIAPIQYESLLTACDRIESEAESAFTVVDMLLVNVGQHHINTADFKTVSIEDCIDHALRRYPFDMKEAQLVHWEGEGDFLFWGNELLCIHVLFNLLKNALYYIRVARKGEIYIWLEQEGKFNVLHFKDTGKGISADVLPHIFDRFYSKTQHGSGIGLAFCKMVMTSFKGNITCLSKVDEFTEFKLYFPVLEE